MEKYPQASLVILWLQLSWVSSEDKVVQSPPSLAVHEGDSATLTCNYEVSYFRSLQWYKQEKNAPIFLFTLTSSGIEKKSGRLSSILDKKELLSTLNITATKTEDSAIYFCAVEEAQCSSGTCSLYPNATADALQL
uniref:Ig-like domain-containing protein n=1 Tax=Prolemur simus TaxID=1328070 RepID=A0A8C8ZP40_PROSS